MREFRLQATDKTLRCRRASFGSAPSREKLVQEFFDALGDFVRRAFFSAAGLGAAFGLGIS
jgi:hypothetical protein